MTMPVIASEIESEDRSPISLRSSVELMAAAHSVLPALAEARVLFADINLRPALPDNLPTLQTQAGLTQINGLFRHGWLIGPALAEQALAGAGLALGAASVLASGSTPGQNIIAQAVAAASSISPATHPEASA
jgi:glycine oxidase